VAFEPIAPVPLYIEPGNHDWLGPMSETVRKRTRTFASAVGLMDEYPEFRSACSQAQQYAWIEERHPELFERMKTKVRDGQWLPVGGMSVEADMNMPSGESIVRQIVFGQRYFESRFVTQKLSWNQTNRFSHHTFWWEGLDGTRVLTHFPPVDLYNAQITPEECCRASEQFSDDGWSDWSLMPFGHGDGGGGPTREMLERARRLEDLDGAPRVSIGSPSEFFEHVEAEVLDGAQVPVWRGELYLEMHRGTLTSQLRTKHGNRRCERLLREVELWSATAGRPADIDDLWREVLTQQFHDIVPGSSIAWVHADADAVFERVQRELRDRIGSLIDELAPREPTAINVAGVDRDEVVVTGSSLGNDHVAVRFDSHGNIVSFIDRVRDVSWEVVESGPLLGRLSVFHAFGPSSTTITYTLRAGSPRLDIAIELDWHHKLDWHHSEHLLSMEFPIDVRADTAACDVQFGHVHRLGHGLFDGVHTVTLALFPHGQGLADVAAEAERFNYPIRVVSGTADAAPASVIELVGDGVELDAIKVADDDPRDLIVRIHEACGDRTAVTVRCATGLVAGSRCNLLEEPQDDLEVVDGIASLTLRPFEIVTLRLMSHQESPK